jgi:crotonobetainyl-CoA:carnitine CoA-transferase CaiB-like acyl-CoA transferase
VPGTRWKFSTLVSWTPKSSATTPTSRHDRHRPNAGIVNVDRCQHVPTSPGQTMCTCLDERMWLRLCLELAARRIVQLETAAQRGTARIIDVTATRKDTPP